MPGSSDLSFSRIRTAPPTYQLSNWPLRDEPLRASMVAMLVIALTFAAAYVSHSWGMGIVIAALLIPASWTLWVPLKFELGAKGIIRSVFGWRRRIPWSEFTGYEPHTHGVYLHHYSNSQPLTTVRGLFLPSKAPHSELLPVLDYYLRSRDADSVSSSN